MLALLISSISNLSFFPLLLSLFLKGGKQQATHFFEHDGGTRDNTDQPPRYPAPIQ
jgi:hypothetical protein